MKVTLKNSFHNTEATVRAKPEGRFHYVSGRAYRAALRKLCGRAGCQCGGIRGGRYSLELVPRHYPAEDYAIVYEMGTRI